MHSARSLLVKQKTMLANAMRGLATEFGVTVPRGIGRLEEFVVLADVGNALPGRARQVIKELLEHCRILAASIEVLEAQIVVVAGQDEAARRLATIPGVGPITASLTARRIDAGLARKAVALLRAQGLPAEAVLARAGLDTQSRAAKGARIPLAVTEPPRPQASRCQRESVTISEEGRSNG